MLGAGDGDGQMAVTRAFDRQAKNPGAVPDRRAAAAATAAAVAAVTAAPTTVRRQRELQMHQTLFTHHHRDEHSRGRAGRRGGGDSEAFGSLAQLGRAVAEAGGSAAEAGHFTSIAATRPDLPAAESAAVANGARVGLLVRGNGTERRVLLPAAECLQHGGELFESGGLTVVDNDETPFLREGDVASAVASDGELALALGRELSGDAGLTEPAGT